MEHPSDKELSIKYAHLFGQIAVRMGFVNQKKVQQALTEQIAYESFAPFKQRKLIGEILFENNWITLDQIEKVVEEITKDKK
jgi:hypothetical protein